MNNLISFTNPAEAQKAFEKLSISHYERLNNGIENRFSRIGKEELLIAQSLKKQIPNVSDRVKNISVYGDHLRKSHQKLLSKALKVKEEYYNKGFYCFLHGNQPERAPLSWLTKELAKRITPTRDLKLFKMFRSKILGPTPTIEDFLKTFRNDHVQRDDLIAVDAYYYNINGAESANFFCDAGVSIHSLENTTDIDPLLEGIPSQTDKIMFLNRFRKIAKEFERSSSCGNLYVICVPKEKVKHCAYRAHSIGKPCKCKLSDQDLFILDELQQDRFPSFLSECAFSQYRILASYLQPENGIRVFLFTPNSQAKLIAKAQIKELADNIFLAKLGFPFSEKKIFRSPQAYHPFRTEIRFCLNASKKTEETLNKIWSHL
jgi:hypothetical protein